MSYLRRFWNNIRNSFYNPGFYAQLGQKRFWRAILVLVGISMISMLAVCVMFAVMVWPFLRSFSSDDFVDKYYPEGLVLTAKDDQFTSNVEEPYIIPLADSLKDESEKFANAVVIDTSDDLTLEQIEAYGAYVVVTKNGIAGTEENGRMRVITLKQSELGDFVINEENASSWTANALSFAKKASLPMLALLFVFGVLFVTLWHMFVLVFAALVVKIVAAVKNIKMPYPNAYVVALFASIPVLILNAILNTFMHIPFLIDIALFVLVVSINLKVNPKATEVETTVAAESAPAVTETD